ncbi:S-layer homology domain-containing protein [Paenibacillus piri]|uniref:S-layer homology domain-containing protein n=1 Tax=Paenibacillus piri TaxID=2547395 RepID=A0A4R5KGG6_9BACL|nr:S-layer homology domain-containing protein [Paenibacillus piri]TDF94443.1 hypothetical protein E1757_23835 [Paenibacillus piri]
MANSVKKAISIIVAFIMLFSTVSAALGANAAESAATAAPSDVSNHWASKEIGHWASLGLVQGNPDGTFKPDHPISRAEFFAFVNRVFQLVDRASVTFPDIQSDAWYADDISKATAAGIVKGDDNGNAKPNDLITRQEAAVVIARAFELQAQNDNANGKFADAAQIASWSKPAVSAMAESGFIQGRPDGSFAPLDNITRAESIKMMDNAMGELKNTPNTYSGSVPGNLVINTRDVTLKDMTINGNLYLTQGIGDGNVILDGVTVKGRTLVRGGGEHSIVIKNSSLIGTLIINKGDGKIRIVSQGTTQIGQVQLNSGAILVGEHAAGNGFGTVHIVQVVAGQEIKLDGNFSMVSIEASNVSVQVANGSIGKMDIHPTAAGTTIQLGEAAVITDFIAEAKVDVKGTGQIVNADIKADGAVFEKKPTNVTVADGVTVTAGGQSMTSETTPVPGSTGSRSSSRGGNSGGNGNGGDNGNGNGGDNGNGNGGDNGNGNGGDNGNGNGDDNGNGNGGDNGNGNGGDNGNGNGGDNGNGNGGDNGNGNGGDNGNGNGGDNGNGNGGDNGNGNGGDNGNGNGGDNGNGNGGDNGNGNGGDNGNGNGSSNTAIVKTNNAAQVIYITEETVAVWTGTTFGQLVGDLKSGDGSTQTYKINNSSAASYILKTNDSLSVTAENGKASKEYKILTVDPAADKLSIKPSEQGVNIGDTSGDVLNITSGSTYVYTVDTAEGAGLTTMEIKTVEELLKQIASKTSTPQTYAVKGTKGTKKMTDPIAQGDTLTVSAGQESRDYTVNVVKGAVRSRMELINNVITANTRSDVVLKFFAGMRSPATEVVLKVPKGIGATMDNTKVNVIGRGEVKLSGLATQSVGRVGAGYRFQQVGTVTIDNKDDGSQVILFKGLDLRPANGADLQITFEGVSLEAGSYPFEASYTTSEPEVLTSPWSAVSLQAVHTISSFSRDLDKSLTYKETGDTYTKAKFSWSAAKNADSIKLLQSTDKGATWTESDAAVGAQSGEVTVANLAPNKEYYFKLAVAGGENRGDSNIAKFYTGKYNVKLMGAKGDGKTDDTQAINDAILYLNSLGGGTLLFENGTFNVRTVHLQSNVYLYVNKDATLSALKGGDAPETTYFSDKAYRSGTSATDTGPYRDPENYLTKQDVGHTFFRNSMFFGERIDNFKIIGNGKITGNGNLVTGDGVMNNAPDNRTDKMVTVKLCTNFEFGGLDNGLDLWYEETDSPTTDEPYYIQSIDADGTNEVRQTNISNMLKVDGAGHFALLATGTDYINTHDFYYDKDKGGGARDVFDYMQSSYVTAKNIYAKGTSDDIVKPGSDSSLGFTRPATTFYVRNIIGDTNCNLFQIGSETVDDIKNAYVDNIYVLAGNKAGFSISTNDGGHIENIYLNSGKTGPIHHKSEMRRTRAPFFISISNRGRVIGGQAKRMKFMENGVQRDELLSTNVNIGHVRNIFIKDVNIEEVYGGSQYSDPSKRWVKYTNQNKATPIIAGYKVGDGGPTLPDGRSVGYIENLSFENVDVLVKGGNKLADSEISPPELGVGKYNIADIGEQPSYGFWARHVDGLTFKNVNTRFEKNDDRYAVVLDDVKNANIDHMKMVKGAGASNVIQLKNAAHITVTNSSFYNDTWGNEPTVLADMIDVTVPGKQAYPPIAQDPHNTSIQLKQAGHPNLTNLDRTANSVTALLGSTVGDITSQLESTDGTVQTYSVTDSTNAPKSSGALETGDILVVTAQDGTTKKNYTINVPAEIVLKGDALFNANAVTKSSSAISLTTSTTNGIAYLQANGVPAGEWIEFNVTIPLAGTYNVSYQYKTNASGRATVQAYVNGEAKGSPVNQNNTTANLYIPVDLGQITFAAAGSYPVRFAATSAGSIVVDYVKFEKAGASAPASSNTGIQLNSNHPSVTAVDNAAKTVSVTSNATVADIISQITSTDGSAQTYSVTDAGNADKQSGTLVTGDRLVVKAADGATQIAYTILAASDISNNASVAVKASHPNVKAVNATFVVIVAGTTVADLLAQIVSADDSQQDYAVMNSGNTPKLPADVLVVGDILKVTAADGVAIKNYLIAFPTTNVQPNSGSAIVIAANNTDRRIAVAATPAITSLAGQLKSTDGTTQTYSFTNAAGAAKTSGNAANGDKLIVTAADRTATATYTIAIAAQAASTNVRVRAVHPHVATIYNKDRSVIAYRGLTADNLLAEVESSDATNQAYSVTDAVYAAKTGNTQLRTGDLLHVTSQDAKADVYYTINLVDLIHDFDLANSYQLSDNSTKSVGLDDTGANYDRNSALNASHMQVNFGGTNATIEFQMNVVVDGTYNVLFGSKKSNTGRTLMQLTVDESNVGPAINETVGSSDLQGMYLTNVGSINLTAGSHTFKFILVDKATGQSFDLIGLEKTN